MKDEERICGLYLRVSTKDQAKERKLYGIIVIEISYLLTDYLGFGYTISTYH